MSADVARKKMKDIVEVLIEFESKHSDEDVEKILEAKAAACEGGMSDKEKKAVGWMNQQDRENPK